jgi:hypothetical protein
VTRVTTERVTHGTLVQVVGRLVDKRQIDVLMWWLLTGQLYGHVDHLVDDKWQNIDKCGGAMWHLITGSFVLLKKLLNSQVLNL